MVGNDKRRFFVEVKEDVENKKILVAKKSNDTEKLEKLKADRHTAKQIKRIERQKDRVIETYKMLKRTA